ncbi:MAG: type VI secretion system protein TssA [Acidobacteria bacterium]|nr:type VI secretion system protein TssA [Acidobacteriota bacterium]
MTDTTTGFQFDLEALLEPVSADSPSGESLRYEGTYDLIREARREDDASLTQGVWQSTLKRANWSEVERLCRAALASRSKDLQLAAWLLEAWLHLHGFAGVDQGLRLYTGLCNKFWDTLYPQAEDGDLEFRAGPINWINEKLPEQIKLLPVTQPTTEETPDYAWSDWEIACRPLPNTPAGKAAAAEARDRVTQAKFQHSASITPTEVFLERMSQVKSAMAACSELEAVLDTTWGKTAPSLRQVWGILDSIRGLIVTLLNQRDLEILTPSGAAEPTVAELNLMGEAADEATPAPAGPRKIRSRAEAYQYLSEAADYLTRTEPHSPTPYLVRRAINWGGMTLEELLGELVRDRGQLQELFRLLQVGKTD